MIRRLWLYPPLAFARLGPSDTPCEVYHWGPNDVRPRGTGKTTLVPAETLRVAEDGAVSSYVPEAIVFKDAQGFRPVCPFFELHAEWVDGNETHTDPVTLELLASFGLSPRDLTWGVHVANLKPYHYTLADGDRVVARLELVGDATTRQPLLGTSPENVTEPLIPAGQHVPLGAVQLTKPSPDFPELRLRFYPAGGFVYGPTNLGARLVDLRSRYLPDEGRETWRVFELPPEKLILNPNAAWCGWWPPLDEWRNEDPRTNPSALYAYEDAQGDQLPDISLGLVDDVCDGIVSCALSGVEPAVARIVVGPPSYAPDRRPFTSIADGLKDRVGRDEVLDEAYVEKLDMTSAEVRDLMERIVETVGLMNLDLQNQRTLLVNYRLERHEHRPLEQSRARSAFPQAKLIGEGELPLTQRGRERHRRFVSLEVFEDMLREHGDLLERVVREPTARNPFYDQRMPALMRGSDGEPMHLTRRQYNLLDAWVRRLRREVDDPS